MTDKTPKRKGGPPPKGIENRKHSGTLCTATRRDGSPCTNFARQASTVCRMHGGSAPQVRRAAQVRILMASDLAAAKLIEMMQSPKVADNIKLAAARDLLDRANLAGTQNVEIGVTKRTYEDVLDEMLVEVPEDMDDDESALAPRREVVIDAEVIEDEPPVRTRHDRAAFAEVDRNKRSQRQRTPAASADRREREAEERASLAEVADQPKGDVTRGREAYLRALDDGASQADARRAGERAAMGETSREGRARVTEADFSAPAPRKRRR